VNVINTDRYVELGTILKEFYWEYLESKSTYENDVITAIKNAFNYSDNTINPYHSGNFNVAFRSNNTKDGAKRFLQEFKEKISYKVIPIINKALEHTSEIRVISLIILPYILEEINFTNSEFTLGLKLAIALTGLVIEGKIRTKKNRILRKELDYIKTFIKNHKEIENANSLIEVLDEIDKE
jgi:hypothetical protein